MSLARSALAASLAACALTVFGAVGPGGTASAAAPLAAQACEQGRTRYVKDTPAALVRLGARTAWRVATGKGVVVAVVDTGVADANAHFPDGVLLAGRSFAGGSARTDPRAHGTAMAGIIAARPLGDRSGVEGLAPQARILPVKVVPDEQTTAEGDVAIGALADGIRYAARSGADVVNVSLSTTTDDPRLRAAVRDATRQGALVVASAGNRRTAQDRADGPRYPAAYPEVVAVAATDADDRVTDDSVHGAHVDLAAPGRDVLTAWGAWGDCYLSQDGESTSYATAYVSAAAALVAQRFPHDGPAGWRQRLEATAARDRRDARDDVTGWGVVQPVEALTAVLDEGIAGPVPPGATPRPSASSGTTLVAVGTVTDPLVADRRQVLWVGIAVGTVVLGLALLRLVRRRRTA
jgi:membrane-anchored mycosin MYCP